MCMQRDVDGDVHDRDHRLRALDQLPREARRGLLGGRSILVAHAGRQDLDRIVEKQDWSVRLRPGVEGNFGNVSPNRPCDVESASPAGPRRPPTVGWWVTCVGDVAGDDGQSDSPDAPGN
jgi:hypothetical protein